MPKRVPFPTTISFEFRPEYTVGSGLLRFSLLPQFSLSEKTRISAYTLAAVARDTDPQRLRGGQTIPSPALRVGMMSHDGRGSIKGLVL
jgi:hypothetical protein